MGLGPEGVPHPLRQPVKEGNLWDPPAHLVSGPHEGPPFLFWGGPPPQLPAIRVHKTHLSFLFSGQGAQPGEWLRRLIWSPTAYVLTLALPLTCCVTLNESPSPPELRALCALNSGNNTSLCIGFLRSFNEQIQVKHLI